MRRLMTVQEGLRSRLRYRRAVLALVLAVGLLLAASAQAGSSTRTADRTGDVCIDAYHSGISKTHSGRTTYDHAASLLQICEGFGTQTSGLGVHWLTPQMQCALIGVAAGVGKQDLGHFIDGLCLGGDTASNPGLESGIGATCTVASDLLGVPMKVLGSILGIGCAGAPNGRAGTTGTGRRRGGDREGEAAAARGLRQWGTL